MVGLETILSDRSIGVGFRLRCDSAPNRSGFAGGYRCCLRPPRPTRQHREPRKRPSYGKSVGVDRRVRPISRAASARPHSSRCAECGHEISRLARNRSGRIDGDHSIAADGRSGRQDRERNDACPSGERGNSLHGACTFTCGMFGQRGHRQPGKSETRFINSCRQIRSRGRPKMGPCWRRRRRGLRSEAARNVAC